MFYVKQARFYNHLVVQIMKIERIAIEHYFDENDVSATEG